MNNTQSSSFRSTSRFVFWWLLAQLAETALRIRSTLTGAPRSQQVDAAEVSERNGTLPRAFGAPEPTVVPSQVPTIHYPLPTNHLSLKPLALAGLAAYVMGIAVVLLIRSQIV